MINRAKFTFLPEIIIFFLTYVAFEESCFTRIEFLFVSELSTSESDKLLLDLKDVAIQVRHVCFESSGFWLYCTLFEFLNLLSTALSMLDSSTVFSWSNALVAKFNEVGDRSKLLVLKRDRPRCRTESIFFDDRICKVDFKLNLVKYFYYYKHNKISFYMFINNRSDNFDEINTVAF